MFYVTIIVFRIAGKSEVNTMKKIELTGQRFGRLLVLKRVATSKDGQNDRRNKEYSIYQNQKRVESRKSGHGENKTCKEII